MEMKWRLEAAIVARTAIAVSVALSGAAPVQAGIPSQPRLVLDSAVTSDLLLKIQTVDPGDGDNGDGDTPDKDNPDRGRDEGYNKYDRSDRLEQRVENWDTDRIIKDLRSIRRECGEYDQVYRIDCLRQGLEMTISNMPNRPEYGDAKRILKRVSGQLSDIVSRYEDRTAPKLEVPRSANPRFKKRRTLRAVKLSSLPRAMAKANAVVEEAATQLLRSAENSERRYAHYQQITAAVDSTKVLLRSG
jgi:hypothetical protein